MAKYEVNVNALKNTDCMALIEAVCRCCNTTLFPPSADIILAVLGIEKVEEKDTNG